MAKKTSNGNRGGISGRSVSKTTSPAVVSSTPVRNSSIPKPQTTRVIVTPEAIAKRAYEISQSPLCGSETDNWLRAERELKGL